MNMMASADLPVAVIGAGPVGLAAAAHLVERGIRPLILERGTERRRSAARMGRMSASSRPGATTSTRRRGRCSSAQAGRRPTPTACRPAERSCGTISRRSLRFRRSLPT